MDAHTFSFYLPALEAGEERVRITGDEHRHLRRVLRIRAGEDIHVTNGRGLLARARVESCDDRATTARIGDVLSSAAPSPRLVVALPLLQRAHFDAAVAQCVELGATAFIPLLAEKCHVRAWTAAQQGRAVRVAVAAMKQSGRGWLPPFEAARDVAALAARAGEWTRTFLADPAGGPLAAEEAGGDTLAVSGPEAGFTERERERLIAAGALPVSLSRHRLRAETAAAVLVSALAMPRPGERR